MKKIMSVLFALLLVAGLVSCGNGNDSTNTTEASQTTTASGDSASSGSFTSDDLYIMVNGVKITVGGTQTDFLAALEGVGVTVTSKDEAASCMFGSTGGKDITFHFDCGDAFTFPKAAGVDNTVDEFFVYKDYCRLKGDITVGATKEQVIAVFGNGFYMIGETMIYNAEGDSSKNDSLPKISFTFEDGVVSAIDLCANLYHV